MKTVTCITCPLGCEITVTGVPGEYVFSGAQCSLGDKYAIKEITAPARVITTSVRINGAAMPLLSVKTSSAVPVNLIPAILDFIQKLKVCAPVKRGDIIEKNICGSGADLVATRTLGTA